MVIGLVPDLGEMHSVIVSVRPFSDCRRQLVGRYHSLFDKECRLAFVQSFRGFWNRG
jgi:hypothetical protein